MLTGRRYKLLLTDEQADYAEQIGSACRAVWNTGLDQRREYRKRGTYINYASRKQPTDQCRELVDAKTEHIWLKDVPGHCLQQTLKDLDRTCREHGTFRVHWRAKRHWWPSFRFPEGSTITVERLSKRTARAHLPKLGWVRFTLSRPLGGTIRYATVSREACGWFLAFCVDDGQSTPERPVSRTEVGVDRGVVTAVACSDGHTADRQFTSTAEQNRYVALQRRLARQQKGSANRRRTLEAMRRMRARERNRRSDFAAQTASHLTRQHGFVAVEALGTKNMTRFAKGTVDEPGSNVKQKAGLNRAILDKGWHTLLLGLRNAARYTGTQIVEVPAAYTSQTCFACRRKDSASRESQARFRCITCGHEANADVNAAKNVLAAGRRSLPAEAAPAGAQQEPAGTREVVPLHPAA